MAVDVGTQKKWDHLAKNFDLMAGRGAEARWKPYKQSLFNEMEGKILFLALGTGLDIATFPPGRDIMAIDISPKMLERAKARIKQYEGTIEPRVMDVHEMDFDDETFDQVFTSCTFCSVPRPVEGLRALKRVLKPGGKLFMFEHTGSHYYPFKAMMNLMSIFSEKVGPSMNRDTVSNVSTAGFRITEVNNIFLDVVKTIRAEKVG